MKNHRFMLLDLRPGAGNMLGPYWEYDPVWLGSPGTLNTSECPKGVVVSSLWQILQASAHSKYFLSPKACLGMLRRSKQRNKPLPPQLKAALMRQAGLVPVHPVNSGLKAYHINQRNEGIDLGEISGALMATSNMQMQTFVMNTYSAGHDVISGEKANTLRAQAHGHQPLVYENHSIDGRYSGPHEISPTISARCGTGGNNTPLVTQEAAYCISGNCVGREPENGGNGIGVQEDISYTLTATDQHCVFVRQRTDDFKPGDLASTQSARQGKDATDLVLEPGVLSDGYPLLIRRLTPLECERLQGFPDGWTDLPGASDSARYKALGNSVAIPCVELLMQGIAAVYKKGLRYELPQ